MVRITVRKRNEEEEKRFKLKEKQREQERIAENLRISKQVTEEASRRAFQGRTRQDIINLEEEELRRDPQLREQRLILQQRATEFAQTQAQEVLETPEQKAQKEEEERLFREDVPKLRQLDPPIAVGITGDPEEFFGGELFPIAGPLAKILSDPIRALLGKDVRPETLQPEVLRNVALTEIERQEIERGLTRSEKFGAFVEALNLGGLENYIPVISGAEKPSGNVQTLLTEIRIWKTLATDAESKIIRNTWTKSFATEKVTEAEHNIQRIQSRIKFLISESAEFKFNSDGVNFIEAKLYEAEGRIFDAKIAINRGPTGDPNELDLLAELQRSIDVEEFDIPGL